MKKLLMAALVAAMCMAFAACGDSGESADVETTAAETTTAATEASGPDYKDISYVKEIESSMNFNMDVHSVTLTPEGDVVMRAAGDLAQAQGWQFQIASGVKDIYVEEFGNGGFYSVILLRDDNTVSAVNTSKIIEDKEVEIMDNLGGYQDVTNVKGEKTEDASVVYVYMSNGDKYLLDEYLK